MHISIGRLRKRWAKERKREKESEGKDLAGVQIDQQYSVYAGIEFYTHLKSNACAEIEIVVIWNNSSFSFYLSIINRFKKRHKWRYYRVCAFL